MSNNETKSILTRHQKADRLPRRKISLSPFLLICMLQYDAGVMHNKIIVLSIAFDFHEPTNATVLYLL
jgi:hypothetical protein